MKVSDFNYDLPEELIAQTPLEKRDESRLMVLDRKNKTIEHKKFKDIIDYLEPGDCLVRNNTKVLPARIYGKKETGANVEFLLLNNIEGDIWETIVRPGNKLHVGTKVIFGEGKLIAEILDTMPGGTRKVQFSYNGIFNEILDEIGLMPLPPYIHEELKDKDRYQTVYAQYDGSAAAPTAGLHFTPELLKKIEVMPLPPYIHEELKDKDRYQTVYAQYDGSAAAPTAGLHFTPELLKKIEEKGVKIANVTLHVGIGTFRPVKEETVENHEMHTEHYYIKEEDVRKINETKKTGKRVIAVGTTSCRVLETIADENGMVKETEGDTRNIYISRI